MMKIRFLLLIVVAILLAGCSSALEEVKKTTEVVPTATITDIVVVQQKNIIRRIYTVTNHPCAKVNGDSVHIRFQPDEHAQAVGWFTDEVQLSVRSQSNQDWWIVYGNGIDFMGRKTRITGYVRSSWLVIVPCKSEDGSR